MTKIVAIAGKKTSGKTTSLNFIHGQILKKNLVVENFEIDEFGKLVVTALFKNEEGVLTKGMGVLDLSQKTPEFEAYASQKIWPLVKGYNFADTLKEICMATLGLTFEQCYGSDEQKNSPTELRWENMPGAVQNLEDKYGNIAGDYGFVEHKPGFMTAREVLQFVGTDLFRRMNQNVWVDSVLNQIEAEQPEVAVIGDCRYVNEIEAVKSRGGYVVRLLRNDDCQDSHCSENDLNNFDDYDCVIDNRSLSISESNDRLLKFLYEVDVLSKGWI
jgi:hypothetical protein